MEQFTGIQNNINTGNKSPEESSENIAGMTEEIRKILGKRFTMNELLSDGWKEKYFKHDDPLMTFLIDNAVLATKDNVSTSFGIKMSKANEILNKNNILVYVVNLEGEKNDLELGIILTKVNNDYIFSVVNNSDITIKEENGASALLFEPFKFGIMSSKGAIFSLDELLKDETREKRNKLSFFEVEGKRHNVNRYHEDTDAFETITNFPRTSQEISTLFHEIGHLLRSKVFGNLGLLETKEDARASYNKAGSMNEFWARKIVSEEERGAWAFDLELIKFLRTNGFTFCSDEEMKIIKNYAQECLKTYDEREYVSSSGAGLDQKIAPQFSNEMRKVAKKLKEFIKANNINSGDVPQFDSETGDMIGQDPNRQRNILEQDLKEKISLKI